ncbi:tropomyosin-like [Oscarella lobularis]|uniref:tropomyosin-like n=1 Tax=Oscarella lobularis TaxID=121494 RepID=UPI003313E3ED
MEQLRNKFARLQEERDKAELRAEKAEKELRDANSHIEEQEREITSLRNKIDLLESEVEVEHQKYAEMKEQYDALVNDIHDI